MKLFKNPTSPFARTAHAMLIEAGAEPDVEIVNPWDSPDVLTDRNPAQRVPTLELDDGTVLVEALLIARHASDIAPEGSHLKLLKPGEAEIAGLAFGVFDAAVYTLNGRKILSGDLDDTSFDETEIGHRRRRTMVEGLKRLERAVGRLSDAEIGLAEITAVAAIQYVDFRFPGAGWVPGTPELDAFVKRARDHASIGTTAPK